MCSGNRDTHPKKDFARDLIMLICESFHMNMTFLTRFVLLSALATTSVTAATINFSSAVLTLETQISTIGTPLGAFYTTGTPLTVNGVDFTGVLSAFDTVNPTFSLSSGITVDVFHGGSVGRTDEANVYTLGSPGGNTGIIIDDFIFPNGHEGSALTFNQLAIGTPYEIQLFLTDTRLPFFAHLWSGTQVGAPALTLDTSTAAHVVTGTFTADSTSQTLTLRRDNNTNALDGSFGPGLNAFQLRTVPEPASAIFLALGGISLCLRRRSRS